MTYTAAVKISRAEFDRINRLLAIESLEEMTDEELTNAGANTFHNEGIFYAKFNDGSSITYDLCSGSENYYDNVVFTDKDGYEHVIDCDYVLDNVYEVEINIVKIELEG